MIKPSKESIKAEMMEECLVNSETLKKAAVKLFEAALSLPAEGSERSRFLAYGQYIGFASLEEVGKFCLLEKFEGDLRQGVPKDFIDHELKIATLLDFLRENNVENPSLKKSHLMSFKKETLHSDFREGSVVRPGQNTLTLEKFRGFTELLAQIHRFLKARLTKRKPASGGWR